MQRGRPGRCTLLRSGDAGRVTARATLEKGCLALQRQELRLYYQPQVNEHGAIIGAEKPWSAGSSIRAWAW